MRKGITVMMLSWEYPPRVIGGISPHVYFLSKNLVKQGINVHVVTCDFPGAPNYEEVDGVEIHRVDSYRNPSPDFPTWIYLMNLNMQKEAARFVKEIGDIDLFHAHDWLVADAGIGLKHVFRKPLVVTMHSSEIGRRETLHNATEGMIHETEAWLNYEAWRVICCSYYMISHIQSIFRLPRNKLDMIPNGVDINQYNNITEDLTGFRSRFALPQEKIILYVGRLVYEKGIHVLIDAIPKVLAKANAKFIIVGSGYMKEQLLNVARAKGIEHKVLFEGFLDEPSLLRLQKCADVSVVPSLFEPFGIVALEAMAAKSPVVVSDTGGISEIVDHDVTGVKVYPGNVDSLAWGINRILLDDRYRQRISENAYRVVQDKYGWEKIAEQTKSTYERILDEYSKTNWA